MLEALSLVHHGSIARILHLCGPPLSDTTPSSSNSGEGSSSSGEGSPVLFGAWSKGRGYDFSFSQSLASGVPINRKDNVGIGLEADLMKLDLAIELVAAVQALHQSAIGSIAHGDLKVSFVDLSFGVCVACRITCTKPFISISLSLWRSHCVTFVLG